MRNLFILLLLSISFPLFSQVSDDPNRPCPPIAAYPLDGDATDSTGNGYGGIVFGPVPTEDRWGNPNSAMLFDGFNDYIELNGNAPILTGATMTITAWARMDGTGGGAGNAHQIFSQRNNGVSTTPTIDLRAENPAGNASIGIRTDGGVAESAQTPRENYGTWHFYVGVIDSASLKIYVDGTLRSTSPFSFAGGDVTNIDRVEIGRQFFSGSANSLMRGAIDDLRIYDCGLSDAQVLDIFSESGSTSINPVDQSTWNVYPNPADDMLFVSGWNAEYNYEVFNGLGQQFQVKADQGRLDVSDLIPGYYFLIIKDRNGSIIGNTPFILR